MLVRNRARIWRSQGHIPTKSYMESTSIPPPPHIKILPNAGLDLGKDLEELAAHTHQILWRVPPPHPSPPISKFYQMLVRNRVGVWRSQRHIPTKYYGEYLHPTAPPPHIKILPNAGQDLGKDLEELAAHTHQILRRVPPPHPPPPCIQILPNAGQEQGKDLEELAAHTHQILWRVPPPHPSPSPYPNSAKCWSGTG